MILRQGGRANCATLTYTSGFEPDLVSLRVNEKREEMFLGFGPLVSVWSEVVMNVRSGYYMSWTVSMKTFISVQHSTTVRMLLPTDAGDIMALLFGDIYIY